MVGSLPTVNWMTHLPSPRPLVLRLKLYPPLGPSVESKRKLLFGLAVPAATTRWLGPLGMWKSPVACTMMLGLDRSVPVREARYILIGMADPEWTATFWL